MTRNGINPITGKRYAWEEEQRALKGDDTRELEQQIAMLQRRKKTLQAADELIPFMQFIMPDPADPGDIEKSMYEATKMHRSVGKEVETFLKGEMRFEDGSVCAQLIFCMPPRHGKTQTATKGAAAWYSGRNPTHQVAVAAYSDTLASEFGSDTRAIIGTPQYKQVFPDYRLRRGGNAKDNLETVGGGRVLFVGRGGALTGRGAHLMLIDDLFKDHEEARSQTIRDQAWNWFTKVAMTRRMGKKLVMITMTRWHSDDIIGRLTDPENPNYNAIEAAKWKIIRLPAIAEDDDPLDREPGEPLWPEKYDLDFLQSQQRLDPLGFAALYQQRPTVADGVLFRRETFQFYEKSDLPADLRIYCASDHAVATGARNDPSVLLKIGVDRQDNIYLLDCIWKKMPTDAAVEAMLALAGGKDRPLLWWAERGHISKSIGPFLRKRMLETGTYINIIEVTPAVDKEQRAQSIAARVAMGKVYFPKGAWWTEKAVSEMLAFPNGNHDDFVDTIAYIGLGLQSQFGPGKIKSREEAPKFGTLAWVKQQDKWAAARRRAASAGGF